MVLSVCLILYVVRNGVFYLIINWYVIKIWYDIFVYIIIILGLVFKCFLYCKFNFF